MQHAELAALLVGASDAGRDALLRAHPALADVKLAYLLKDICLDAWSTHPARALGAAAALHVLAILSPSAEITALEFWGLGLKAVVGGQMEQAISALEDAQTRFLELGQPRVAAETQVGKLVALAMLGRYDQAIATGLAARDLLLTFSDNLAVGKIEHNIGNIYFRRDQYEAAEKFQSSARERFILANDPDQLTKIENSLALTLAQQYKIHAAEDLYQQALKRAEAAGQPATQAAIESSIGTLALYQGRYDRALDYLERSRRKYAQLGMSHLSAMTEQEIADAYLELNLIPEAREIYERVTRTFAELGMRAEGARALVYNSRAAIMMGQTEIARDLLNRARTLYEAEGNRLGVAVLKLTEAQLSYMEQNCAAARRSAIEAEPALAAGGASRRLMFARWLHGEAARGEGLRDEALEVLQETLSKAQAEHQTDIAARCLTSLGLLAAGSDDVQVAERSFRSAIALIEALRAPLPAEEFRSAFFSDKLVPYNELVRLCLDRNRIAEAFAVVESARSRALADVLSGNLSLRAVAQDEFEADSLRQIERLREELNYLYSQLTRPRGYLARDQNDAAAMQQTVRERERELLTITRQIQHRAGKASLGQSASFSLAQLQRDLTSETALLEYATVGEELIAFLVTNERIEVFRELGIISDLAGEIEGFRFQIDTLRHGSERVRRHLPELTVRVRARLASLYDRLLRPIEPKLAERKLVIVPHSSLHYLPFSALYDGTSYLIERREICSAPSALVLQQCLGRPRHPLNSALLMGAADEEIPRVHEEIEAIAELFPGSLSFLGVDASLEKLREHSAAADVVHLACHGQFRSDNPLFSSLRLGNGWLTVRDAYDLKLSCGLVTLSACETGVNAIAPGDELIGLARGFFSAGTPSILLSLWTVDDEATAILMTDFYRAIRTANSPAAALRAAQVKMLNEKPHPFFWAPFVLFGRW